ncbi:hypothetical protein ACTXT7_003725 [Hymenolepis weldensis]
MLSITHALSLPLALAFALPLLLLQRSGCDVEMKGEQRAQSETPDVNRYSTGSPQNSLKISAKIDEGKTLSTFIWKFAKAPPQSRLITKPSLSEVRSIENVSIRLLIN